MKTFCFLNSDLNNLPNDVACDLYMKPGGNSDELVKNDVPTVRSGHWIGEWEIYYCETYGNFK